MKKSTKIHFLIVSFINLLVAARLLFVTFESNSCKSVILIIIPFPVLIFLNGTIGLVFFLLRKSAHKVYVFNTLGLVLLLFLGIALAVKG
ncbi:hypothetical protein WAF17_17320 [Bernardetia sp. ABR2-2B]|uniref:hypothetical protein n=1 Tax=Bernardetia sp. ABR2-2B TaxID=3127472 RepID=UPI0030CD748F